MDIDLGPGMDGTKAAQIILGERDVALAFLSSHTEPEVVDRTEGITSYGYIVKNSGDTVLLASIRMAFRLHAAHLELKRQKEHLDLALVREEHTSEQLQQKSDELERYFSSSLDMLCIVSPSGEFLRLNPEWERVLGHSLTNMQGRSVVDFVHPDDRDATVEETERLRNGEEVQGFENRCRCIDGSYRWIEWRTRLVGSAVYAAARDVTDRRRALAAARESEGMFRNLMEHSVDAVQLLDERGRFLDVNRAACEMVGHTREELLEMRIADIDPNYPDDGFATFWRDQPKGTSILFETQHRHKNGRLIPVEVNGIFFELNGRPYLYGVARDLTERKRAEEALRTSEERFRAVLDGVSSVAVQSYRPDGTTQYWNAASERLYGYSADEAVGRNLLELIIPPEARELVAGRIRAMATTGEAEPPSDLMLMRKDGSRVMVYSSHAVVRLPGREQELFCMDIDVSEQKQNERELIRQRQYLEAVLRTSADGFWVVDSQGRLLEANDVYSRMTGYTRDELITMTVSDIDVDERPAETRDHIQRVMRNHREVFEARHRRKDGTVIDVEVSVSVLPDSDGHLVCFCRDITGRKRVEHQRREAELVLRDERARLAGIIAGTNVGTWEWNIRTGETVFNDRWAEMIGYALDELAPVSITTWERFAHPDDLPQSAALLQKHFDGATEFYDIECRMRHKDGRWIWVHDRGKIISRTADGEPLLMMGTHQEITERKQAEARIHQLVGEKETLLKEVQHRVKNTMNTMVSLISFQAAGLRDERAVAALNDATARLRSMEVLYDQLYRTESHDAASAQTYLERLVGGIVDLFPMGERVRVDLHVEDLAFDTRRMSTLGIIANELVTNALKYAFGDSATNAGRLSVLLTRSQDRVTLVVEDDGPGLPESFELDATTGFGMTMIRALAGQLDGTLRFERADGTRAVLEFPT